MRRLPGGEAAPLVSQAIDHRTEAAGADIAGALVVPNRHRSWVRPQPIIRPAVAGERESSSRGELAVAPTATRRETTLLASRSRVGAARKILRTRAAWPPQLL